MNVVICDHHRYDSVVRVGSHHIAAELLRRGHKVSWLPHARSWLHRLLGPLPPRLREHGDGVQEITLRAAAPYIGLPGLSSLWWGRRWLSYFSTARSRLASAGLDRVDLLWLSDFTMLPIVGFLEPERVVFRFFDHLEGFRWTPASIYALTRHYLARADLVLASSRGVQARLAEEGIEALYLPNGANPDIFAAPSPSPREDRAVYVGALEEWFDLQAVESWAAGLPEVTFDICGPNPRRLRSRLGNIRFLGPIPYRELPLLLSSARFGLIPFRLNGLTRGVHPIKLYDYLAAGCPVLCADLPEVSADPRGVFRYRTPQEGLELLRELWDRPFDRSSLRRMAEESRWDRRLAPVFARLGLGEDQ